MPGDRWMPSTSDHDFLLKLQRQALAYFRDNQARDGLVLDRQSNRDTLRASGWCSTAATGMGLIAVALAAASPYRLLTPGEAVQRVRATLETALGKLRHDHGIMPHFLDSRTGAAVGADVLSTIDSAWLIVGGLWAAAFLRNPALEDLAQRLYERVDWLYWTAPHDAASRGLLRHGEGADGTMFPGCWDRLDGEAVHMYVLGSGPDLDRALPAESWKALGTFYRTVAGLRFNNADLGLFAFQYGLDLLDFRRWHSPDGVDLAAEAVVATRANYLVCRENAANFATYRRFWGLSDGDGPGAPPVRDAYRAYGPGWPIDGTAHLTATLASVANAPDEVLESLREAGRDADLRAHGRYGFSSVNLDRGWVANDMVGIDAGAAVLALDNVLCDDRVRRVFHSLPCVKRALQRLDFKPVDGVPPVSASVPSITDEI
jgi:hypothetical protein